MNRKLVLALAPLALAGCASGQVECQRLTEGACKVSFNRFLTDTSFTVEFPQGGGATYSSNPNEALAGQALASVNRLTGTVEALIGRRLAAPEPVVPPPPLPPTTLPENPNPSTPDDGSDPL